MIVTQTSDIKDDSLGTEREGFEPSVRFRTLDFKSSAFDHSATSPGGLATENLY